MCDHDVLNILQLTDFVCTTGNLTCVVVKLRAVRGSQCGKRDAFMEAIL